MNEDGTTTRQERYGSMATIDHASVLKGLAERASRLRYKGKLTYSESPVSSAADETGTVNITELNVSMEKNDEYTRIEQQERIRVREAGIPDEVLNIHGTFPGSKSEGTTRLIYENIDGLNNRLSKNEKLNKMRELHNDLEVDIAAYNEHKTNMAHKSNINGFNQ